MKGLFVAPALSQVLIAVQISHRAAAHPPACCRYSDHEKLRPAANCAPRDYPKPDAQITFDLNTSLFRFVDRLVQAY